MREKPIISMSWWNNILIYTSKAIVPFENHFPEDTQIYKILSTKPTDSEAVSAEKDNEIKM